MKRFLVDTAKPPEKKVIALGRPLNPCLSYTTIWFLMRLFNYLLTPLLSTAAMYL